MQGLSIDTLLTGSVNLSSMRPVSSPSVETTYGLIGCSYFVEGILIVMTE